ncbi:MAG: DUF4244 domain-containing protein [Acidimicrobiales bacterium]
MAILSVLAIRAKQGMHRRTACADDSGQATAEYALVMLAAAGIAGVALAWAVGGGGIERLLDAVLDSIIAGVTG